MKQELTNIAKKIFPFTIRKCLRVQLLYLNYFLQTYSTNQEVVDPILNKQYKGFVKKGNSLINYQNESKNRDRLVWLFLERKTKALLTSTKVLHVSPEHCFYDRLSVLKPHNYLPIDKFSPGYDYQTLVQNDDLLSLSLSSNSVEAIICNHVLEHIEDDATAMNELFRVLKPEGELIVTVPILPNNSATYENSSIVSARERKKHFGQWDHVRYYGLDIAERLSNAGFEVKVFTWKDFATAQEFERFKLCDDYIFYCTK